MAMWLKLGETHMGQASDRSVDFADWVEYHPGREAGRLGVRLRRAHTPFEEASANQHNEVTKLLLEYGSEDHSLSTDSEPTGGNR
jgi:hypothetical protein